MTLRFGTDGVRGVANVELTPELALAMGRAAAEVLGPAPAIAVGRDTRLSGPLLEAAFAAGAASAGVDVLLLGVVPTPAVAWVCADHHIPGAVISASHNRFADNGIKLFAAGGRKLADDLEAAVEAAIAISSPATDRPTGTGVGSILVQPDLADAWAATVAGTLDGRRLDGLRVVVDCANGAGSELGPIVLSGLGADVVTIHAVPDGTNINDGCGATDTASLRAAVVGAGAHLGIALDGDADRCIAVDAAGDEVDGDQILAILAVDRAGRGALPRDTVVVTVMSNLGFRLAMQEQGLVVVETPVGDRAVLEALEAGAYALGGEQSGHVIQRDLATTGDGILTAVHLCDVLARTGQPLRELAAVMQRMPQVLRNVAVDRQGLDIAQLVASELAEAEAELDGRGRVLLRPSGTEQLVRVMVEAPTEEQAAAVADRLAAAVAAAVAAATPR